MHTARIMQYFILVSFIATAAMLHWLSVEATPPSQWRVSAALLLLYAVAAPVILRVRQRLPSGAGDWLLMEPLTVWLAHIPMIAGAWLIMPAASEAVQLLLLVTIMGAMTVLALGSARVPPSTGFGSPMPLLLPLNTALFFLVHSRFGLIIAVWLAAASFAFLFSRYAFEQALNREFHARQALAMERDARTRFLASASHDLDQPLQAARLSFEQAMRAPEGERRERASRRVRWALDSAQRLVAGISEHLRLEAGAVTARHEPVPLGHALSSLLEMLEPAAKAGRIELRAVPSSLTVMADPHLLDRILTNLVTNAVRHSGGRRVLIGARRMGSVVQLWVIDDGAGIPEAERERVFTDYAQGDHGDQMRGGFGLGLASARRMAELIGGTLTLDARWVNGCAFRVELPRA